MKPETHMVWLNWLTFRTYSEPLRLKSLPPIVNVIGGKESITSQFTVYSPMAMGKAPMALFNFATSADGPAISEVPGKENFHLNEK